MFERKTKHVFSTLERVDMSCDPDFLNDAI